MKQPHSLVIEKLLRRHGIDSAGEVRSADAVVALGCKVNADGAPSRALEERILAAVELYEEGVAPHVVVTGGSRWQGHPEAEVMRRRVEDCGVPPSAILVEGESTTTIENGTFTARIMRDAGLSSVVLVTQPLHLPRALRAFSAAGLDARGFFIADSYQLRGGPRLSLARDLLREVGASALEVLHLLR